MTDEIPDSYRHATFEGDDYWTRLDGLYAGTVSHATRRINPVLQAEVMKRVYTVGAVFMRAVGDAVNAGKDSLDIYGHLVEGDEQTWSGLCMGAQPEMWNTLAFLTAPAERKWHYQDQSAFFRQVCAAFADAMDAYDQKIEDAPMLVGREDPDTGEVQWHGWAPWMTHEVDQMRWYASQDDWWYEIWEDDEQ